MNQPQVLPLKVQHLETANKYAVFIDNDQFTLIHYQTEELEESFEILDLNQNPVDEKTFDEVLEYWEDNF